MRRSASYVIWISAIAGCARSTPPSLHLAEGTPAPAPQAWSPLHHDIKVADLPAPTNGRVENPPTVVARPPDAALLLPPGFVARTFATTGPSSRWMMVAPNGDVFVTDSDEGTVTILRDANSDGTPEATFTFATGLKKPFGMAISAGWLYVGNTNAIVRFHYKDGQTAAEGEPEKISALPGRGYREHWTRNIVFNPQGTKLYATVGSQSNVDADPPPRASILEMNPDGSGARIFASGTRNPIGLAFNPTTHALWAAVQERDLEGEDLVPDFVTQVKDGGFYGWPYAYIGAHEDPSHRGEHPELVAKTIVPDVLVQAHSAVLGLVFYEGNMFPRDYEGDAFVACHGSWNRAKRTGYKIIRIRFKDGRPLGGYDDFVTGWMLGEDKVDVWGRPVGLVVAKDGALLIADDGAHTIWRVSYAKK